MVVVVVQFVIDQGCLPVFSALLTHQKNSIQKEAAWMISNVTAGNVNQIQAVIDHGLIPPVVDIIAKVTALHPFTSSIIFLVAVQEITDKAGVKGHRLHCKVPGQSSGSCPRAKFPRSQSDRLTEMGETVAGTHLGVY